MEHNALKFETSLIKNKDIQFQFPHNLLKHL